MQLAIIRARAGAGYAAAAGRLGVAGTQYRPASGLSPQAEVYATPVMAFDDTARFGFTKVAGWGAPMRYALIDSSDVMAGDILVCGQDTVFVARVEDFRPPLCVLCDRTVDIAGAAGSGVPVVSRCPAAVIMHSRGEYQNTGMPGSMRPGQFLMYLPLLPGVMLTPYMVVTTDLGVSYTVSAVEVSSFGFRCTVSMQQV